MANSQSLSFRLSQTELKIFGCSLMLVDHIGLIFFPQLLVFRLIGRLSFPIFAWFFAYGYLRTRDWKTYFFRLLLAGIVSQPFYSFMVGKPIYLSFNILLTFAFNLALFKFAHYTPRYKPLILIFGMVLETWLNFEYGWYATAVILLLISWLYNKDIKDYVFWQGSWWFLNLSAGIFMIWYQPFAALSSFIFDATDTSNLTPSLKWHRLFFYLFYPLHIALLLSLRYF